MLWEIIVISENYEKSLNKWSGQNRQFVDVTTGGTYSYHWTLNG